MIPPIPCVWDGEAFYPRRGFQKKADQHFVAGETYQLQVVEERSAASHRHYFACINEAWQNLPDHLAERLHSPEALRKYALVKAGFADSRTIDCSSKAEARRLAAFIAPMDPFAIVKADGSQVHVWTAQSQSMRAMGKEKFQESKDRVIDVLADMLGVSTETLNSARAA